MKEIEIRGLAKYRMVDSVKVSRYFLDTLTDEQKEKYKLKNIYRYETLYPEIDYSSDDFEYIAIANDDLYEEETHTSTYEIYRQWFLTGYNADMLFEDLQKIVEHQKERNHDQEYQHIYADSLLCRYLASLGYKRVADEYFKIGKWYA